MSAIEFDTTELREIISKSLLDDYKSLETIFADTESIKVKDEQIKAEFWTIIREKEEYFQEESFEYSFKGNKVFYLNIENKLSTLKKKFGFHKSRLKTKN
ncbi:MAG: hypothetical protein QNJ38_09345 [Prochloraceae cyanobacterium]|nr:hypothetical protein [Prochloraceae cyanobacterium]